MNVYDFDKTIYNGDSTIDFYLYCIKKHPKIIFCLPRQIYGAIRYMLKIIDKTKFKEEFYCFLSRLNNIDLLVSRFWDVNQNKLKKWYKEIKKDDDLIISASPEFLLAEICKREKIDRLIASKVDKKNGNYIGKNCYGEEKVNRYKNVYKDCAIDNFYSDSRSDQPLANLAQNSFLVVGECIKSW